MPAPKKVVDDSFLFHLFTIVALQKEEDNYAVSISARVKRERAFTYKKLMLLAQEEFLSYKKLPVNFKTVFYVNWSGVIRNLIGQRNNIAINRYQRMIPDLNKRQDIFRATKSGERNAYDNKKDVQDFVREFITSYLLEMYGTKSVSQLVTLKELLITFIEAISATKYNPIPKFNETKGISQFFTDLSIPLTYEPAYSIMLHSLVKWGKARKYGFVEELERRLKTQDFLSDLKHISGFKRISDRIHMYRQYKI